MARGRWRGGGDHGGELVFVHRLLSIYALRFPTSSGHRPTEFLSSEFRLFLFDSHRE